jgi:hypothetical protein
LHKSVEWFERSKFGFGGVDPRVLFIPSCPRLHRSDRCSWPVWPVWTLYGICLRWTAWLVCILVVVILVSSWSVWSCFARLCVGFSFRAGCVFGSVFVLGPREVTKAV